MMTTLTAWRKTHGHRIQCAAIAVTSSALWLFSGALLPSAAENGNGNAAAVPSAVHQEFFPADTLLRGFSVSPPMIAREIPLSQFHRLPAMLPSDEPPFWSIAQWYCVQSLAETDCRNFNRHDATWSNDFESLRVAIEEGRPAAYMSIDSLAIYNHDPIPYDRMPTIRPHFLLTHDFYPDVGGTRVYGGARMTVQDGSTFPDFNTLKALVLRLKVRLVKAQDMRDEYKGDLAEHRRPLYNRNRFDFWFRVYCRNHAWASYGKFFWLGFRIYDSDMPYSSPIPYRVDQIVPDGAGDFAYKLCDMSVLGEDYKKTRDAFMAGKEISLNVDVLGLARKGIQALQQKEHAFTDAPDDLSGFTLSHFNTGWELASPFRGTMMLRDLSLQGDAKVPDRSRN